MIGSLFDDRFEIIEFIGAGGWGNVYKARHLTLGINVAIKIIHKHLRTDNSSLLRLQREALLLSRLDSPHIIKFMDYGLTPAPFIVMEFFDGEPLDQWLNANKLSNSSLLLELFMQICEGLSCAHAQGLVHRDLKPANIMLRFENGKLKAKILDFGIAKPEEEETRLTYTGELVGSPAYMPPEQWKGQSDCRSDIYSFGCLMFEALNNRAAFEAKNRLEYMDKHLFEIPSKLRSDARSSSDADSLEDVISKCLEKLPENRYQSADEVYAEFERIKTGRKLLIHLNKELSVRRKRKALVSVSGLVCVLAMLWLIKDALLCPWMHYFNTLADTEKSQAKYSAAIEDYRLSLLPANILSEQNKQVLHAMRMLSACLIEEKQSAGAIVLQRRIAKLIGANCSSELTNDLRSLQHRIYVGAPAGETQYLAHKADEDARNIAGKNSLAYSEALDAEANVLKAAGSSKEALQAEEQSLQLAIDLLEPGDIKIAERLNSRADILTASGNLKEAEQNYQRAIEISLQSIGNPSKLEFASASLETKPAPLLLADFNNGKRINNLDSEMGTWERDLSDSTQGTRISFASDDAMHDANGKSLVLDYDVDSPNMAFSGYWMKIGGRDFSKYDTLNFYIKGDKAAGFTKRMKVELKDFTNKASPIFVNNISDKWQKISIPFSKLKMVSDWGRMNEFTVGFEDVVSTPKTGRIYIDNIFVSSENQDNKNLAVAQLVRAYNGCASIQMQRNDMQTALAYLQRAQQLCQAHEEQVDSLPTYLSLAKLYEQAGDSSNATDYWMMALKTHVEDGSAQSSYTGATLDALARIHSHNGDTLQAQAFAADSLKVRTQSSSLDESLRFVLGKDFLHEHRSDTLRIALSAGHS